MTSIQGGGSYVPMESPQVQQVTKPQETITQDKPNDVCNTPTREKKEVPLPILTGIEAQLDESFQNFKGNLKEAKDKLSDVHIQGVDKGITANINTSSSLFTLNSFDVKAEGKDVVINQSPNLINNQ
jgi:hypothetical protein